MTFLNKLNDTYDLLNKLDDLIIKNSNNSLIKKHLISASNDLAKYKDIDEKNIKLNNDEIKFKIAEILNSINEIEINVKNKLLIANKYNSYLNS